MYLRQDIADGWVEVDLSADLSSCGWAIYGPDPRKRQHAKKKYKRVAWGVGGVSFVADLCAVERRIISHPSLSIVGKLIRAGVAQVEEHRFRKPKRAVSTIASGSNISQVVRRLLISQ